MQTILQIQLIIYQHIVSLFSLKIRLKPLQSIAQLGTISDIRVPQPIFMSFTKRQGESESQITSLIERYMDVQVETIQNLFLEAKPKEMHEMIRDVILICLTTRNEAFSCPD